MIALSARQLGYRVHVFAPDAARSPAGQVADLSVTGDYLDAAAIRTFADAVDVLTVEFENIPASALAAAAEAVPVRPGITSLRTTQNRGREKRFLADTGVPHARFAPVDDASSLDGALGLIGMPAVLKTAGFGYDGKGQKVIRSEADLDAACALAAQQPCVLEEFVDFVREVSVISARNAGGETATFGLFENVHRDHILDVTLAGTVPADLQARAGGIAERIGRELDHVGVFCVELFETRAGGLLVNEVAPRVHNSGHITIESARTSQFEQHVRAICGLPLGATGLLSGGAMANLLGDLWTGGEPDWAAALEDPRVKLHLYGKSDARPGRKMGHLSAVADSASDAVAAVTRARARLSGED